jgi:hypothetical protein
MRLNMLCKAFQEYGEYRAETGDNEQQQKIYPQERLAS